MQTSLLLGQAEGTATQKVYSNKLPHGGACGVVPEDQGQQFTKAEILNHRNF